MSLQNTDAGFKAVPWDDAAEMVRALRGALQDEIGATNLYSKIISTLRKYKNTASINEDIEAIKEIMNDEKQHQGKLIAMIAKYDNEEIPEMVKGVQGK